MSFCDIVIDAAAFVVCKIFLFNHKINSFNLMEKEKKMAYEEPRVELFGIMAEGVICSSPVPPGGIEGVEDEGDLS